MKQYAASPFSDTLSVEVKTTSNTNAKVEGLIYFPTSQAFKVFIRDLIPRLI